MEEQREKFLIEEYNKKRLLEDNLEDVRGLIRISKKINESQEYMHNFELEQKGIALDKKEGTIFAMRDALIQVFQYLNNTKKLDSFMKNKHNNSLLVLMQLFTTQNNDLSGLRDELIKLANDLRLIDVAIPKELIEEEGLE